MYAESAELFSPTVNPAAELVRLARAILTDGMRLIALIARSGTGLAAENLFLENNSPSNRNAESARDARVLAHPGDNISSPCYAHTVSMLILLPVLFCGVPMVCRRTH